MKKQLALKIIATILFAFMTFCYLKLFLDDITNRKFLREFCLIALMIWNIWNKQSIKAIYISYVSMQGVNLLTMIYEYLKYGDFEIIESALFVVIPTIVVTTLLLTFSKNKEVKNND